VQRAVINDTLSGSSSYSWLLSDSHSVFGVASVYASSNENRYRGEQTRTEIGLRSQVRLMQLQTDYTGVDLGKVRRASISVAMAFDIAGASNSRLKHAGHGRHESGVDQLREERRFRRRECRLLAWFQRSRISRLSPN
jgi:hypothetical protein